MTTRTRSRRWLAHFGLAGHEATVCDNAARALELAKAERFDLILSDVVMPGRDGIALLEDFKSIGVASPVVMMSGQATIEMAVRATRLGAHRFSREADLHRKTAADGRKRAAAVAHLEEENRDLKRQARAASDRLGQPRDARGDGAGGARWRRAKRAFAFAARREPARN